MLWGLCNTFLCTLRTQQLHSIRSSRCHVYVTTLQGAPTTKKGVCIPCKHQRHRWCSYKAGLPTWRKRRASLWLLQKAKMSRSISVHCLLYCKASTPMHSEQAFDVSSTANVSQLLLGLWPSHIDHQLFCQSASVPCTPAKLPEWHAFQLQHCMLTDW